jgi:hypothetical protein
VPPFNFVSIVNKMIDNVLGKFYFGKIQLTKKQIPEFFTANFAADRLPMQTLSGISIMRAKFGYLPLKLTSQPASTKLKKTLKQII